MKNPALIIKADGTKEPFDSEKLVDSLENAGGSREVIIRVVKEIESKLHDGMETSEIYTHAFSLLREYSLPVAVKYSLRRALSELGPDGFPFEKYVARIFEAWGYETLTDQMVFGECVPHEVDVVAWNDKKLFMVEAKFHNEFGLKSDVKVALYVKARFDDLKVNVYDYGGIKRKMDEGWLITNTKFSEQAMKYGECKKLKMIGWNYPLKGNLQDIIEELHLHPFTCLVALSNVHKKLLLAKGAILCKDIVEHPEYLHEIGMNDEEIMKVSTEATSVCGL